MTEAELIECLRDSRHCNDWWLRQQAANLIERLVTRLEIPAPPFEAYDGIACRDETIKLLDKKVAAEKARADRYKSKLDAITKGDSFLYLRDEDREKAACELSDEDLLKWCRWALIKAASLYTDDGERRDRSVMEIMSTQAIVTLARLVHDTGATKGSFEVSGASWPGKPNATGGDWLVTIERIDAALKEPRPIEGSSI